MEAFAHSGHRLSVAQFLTLHINQSDKSQTQMAEELGYPNPNIITMFKQGRTKIPLNIIDKLAQVLDFDPIYFLRLVLHEYDPQTLVVIDKILGRVFITADEMAIIETVRAAADAKNIPQL
jgi:plasmid maintenance system antidote protein VapI